MKTNMSARTGDISSSSQNLHISSKQFSFCEIRA
jgi:hypothetical protein